MAGGKEMWYKRIPGADVGAPVVATRSTLNLSEGVYQRVMVDTRQIFVRLGTAPRFLAETSHFPAGARQPLHVQVAVLRGLPPEDIVIADGTTLLWEDDIVLAAGREGDAHAVLFVSAGGQGDRPTAAPCLGPSTRPKVCPDPTRLLGRGTGHTQAIMWPDP